jgi:integrase
MARTSKLTAVEVARAKGPAVLHDGGGLYLRVSATGAKSWVFRFQVAGRRRDMGLGAYPALSLADARGKAADARRQLQDGVDPLSAKRSARQAQRFAEVKGRSFRQTAEEFIARNEAAWRNSKHRNQWRTTLSRYVFPILGDLPISAIDTDLIVRVLEQPTVIRDADDAGKLAPFWRARPATASRVRGRIEAILDAATVRGLRQGSNPAQWKGGIAHILPPPAKLHKVQHHAALPFDEIAPFLADLRTRTGLAGRAFEFAILTAARTGEVLGARWGEIDLSAKLWTISADRMKAGREHRVPLSGATLEILTAVRPLALTMDGKPDPAAPIFPGTRRALPLSSAVLLALLRRMKRTDLTAHGFRSTFRDWAAERTAFPREVVEMALAHAIANPVEAAYRRGDLFEKRRQLMESWATFCTTPAAEGTVVPLRAGA